MTAVYSSGPNGLAPSVELAENLRNLGLPMRRFKTGTPARALAEKALTIQRWQSRKVMKRLVPFSFMNDEYRERSDFMLADIYQ